MTRDQIRESCKGMTEGETRTFTLDQRESIKFLSEFITDDRHDNLAVKLSRQGNQVTAKCYRPEPTAE